MTKNKKHKHYTEDFRRGAPSSCYLNTSAAEVACEPGIHPSQIYNWYRQCKRLSEKQFNSTNDVDYSKLESEEVCKLKRQIADLKEENEFLKNWQRRTSVKTNGEVRLH